MTQGELILMPHHSHREDIIGEHKYGDLGQLLLLILFLIIWILDSFLLNYTTFLTVYLPLWAKLILFFIVFCVGIYLAKVSHDLVFGEVREKAIVIDYGIYSKMRHPMYLAAILFYLGLLILAFSIAAACLWIIIIGFYDFIARHEEKMLSDALGDSYTSYMENVPRWIPRLKK